MQKMKESKYDRRDLKRTVEWIKIEGYTITREDKTKKMVFMEKKKDNSF